KNMVGLPRFELDTSCTQSSCPTRQTFTLLNLEDRHSYRIDYSGIPRSQESGCKLLKTLVGAGRFERPTPCAQGRCATRLRYAPTFSASLILNHFPNFRYRPACPNRIKSPATVAKP